MSLGFHAQSEAPVSAEADTEAILLLDAEGNAFVNIALTLDHSVVLDAEGNAFADLSLGKTHDITLPAEGNAFASLDLGKLQLITIEAEGNAFASAQPSLSILLDPDPVVGRAIASIISAQLIKPVVNPPRGGQLVDWTDPNVFTLTVNNTVVDLSGSAIFNMSNLQVSYDSKQLIFTEIGCIGFPTFAPEQEVLLDVAFPISGTTTPSTPPTRVFSGNIRVRRSRGVNNQEGFVYTAVGKQDQLGEITLISTSGRPEVIFTAGTTITGVDSVLGTEITTTFVKFARDVITEIFTLARNDIGSAGLSTELNTNDLFDLRNVLVPETLNYKNQSVLAAVRDVLSLKSGKKIFWDDPTQRWTFPNILDTPLAPLQINSINILTSIFNMSTQDRYTAVHLYSELEDVLDDAITTKSQTVTTPKGTFTIQRSTVTLTPKWRSGLENQWTFFRASSAGQNATQFENQFFWPIFRVWSIPNSVLEPTPGTPVRAMQKVIIGSQEVWQRLRGRARFGKIREFVANEPAIVKGSNPFIPGDAVGPVEVQLTYYPRQAFFGTVVTSVTTEGTPTFGDTLVDASDFLFDVRVPSSGFQGTAFDLFGVQRELREIVSPTEVTSANALARLNLMKDVIIDGEFPIEGDMIESLFNLNIKLNLQHDTNTTGIESIESYVTQFNYRFGKRGVNRVQVTSDIAAIIGRS